MEEEYMKTAKVSQSAALHLESTGRGASIMRGDAAAGRAHSGNEAEDQGSQGVCVQDVIGAVAMMEVQSTRGEGGRSEVAWVVRWGDRLVVRWGD